MEGKQLPALAIGWDADKQQVLLDFNPEHFRTWDFVLALLQMAQRKAETQLRSQQVQAMAEAQQQAQQNALLRKQILRGH